MIKTRINGVTRNRDFIVQHLQSVSWNNCYGAAHLYIPSNNDADKGLPVVLLACGHGNNGKLYPAYRKMAEYLASSGIAVLVPDNIGQGERHFMGHYSAPGVFECGLTVQGLIVMETIGWLNWIRKQKILISKRLLYVVILVEGRWDYSWHLLYLKNSLY